MGWFLKYRDLVLFIWGIALLTFIILFHVVTDTLAYLILAGAIGLPLAAGQFGGNGNGKKKDDK